MGVIVASEDKEVSTFVCNMLNSTHFKGYTCDDVISVEIGGAIKNPLAIGAGVVDGLGYGASSLAAFVTRGCSEMRKLAIAMGGRRETLAGLSGFGDLMLTCSSRMSRNQTVGRRLATGENIKDILASMEEVAEGVPTASVAAALCDKYGLDLPIFTCVNRLLSGEITPDEAHVILMARPTKDED